MKLALPDSRKCPSVCTGYDILCQASLLLWVSIIIKQNPPHVGFSSHNGHVSKTSLSQDYIKCTLDTGARGSKLFELPYEATI